MKCHHRHTVVLESHTICCTGCGLVLGRRFDPTEMKAYADYTKEHIKYPYTRYKRFRNLIHNIVYGYESPSDRKMLQELSSLSITSVPDIITGMVKSGHVDKRYCSLRLFMKCFLPKVSVSDITHFKEHETQLLSTFKQIEFKLANTGQSFVNYRFTLDALLHFFGLDEYRIFIKPLKCTKRVLQNIKVLNACTIITDGKPFVIPDTFVMSPRSLFRPREDRV
jgi:hypothetical protein